MREEVPDDGYKPDDIRLPAVRAMSAAEDERVWAVPIIGGKGANANAGGLEAPRAVLGFDPGSEAACVVLSLVSDRAIVWRFRPRTVDGFPLVDLSPVQRVLRVPPVCFVEKISPEGRWGKSNFAFGARAGAAVALLASYGWPVRMVRPQQWQASVHLRKGKGEGKARSLEAYRDLFPYDPLPKNQIGGLDHNEVDALLIAVHGARELGTKCRRWQFQRGRAS